MAARIPKVEQAVTVTRENQELLKFETSKNTVDLAEDMGKAQGHVVSSAKALSEKPSCKESNISIIKVTNSLRRSLGYQTVEVSVGVELPWSIDSTSKEALKESLNVGYQVAQEFVEGKLAEEAVEVDVFLKKLGIESIEFEKDVRAGKFKKPLPPADNKTDL